MEGGGGGGGRATYERGKVLETVWFADQTATISEHEGDLDDAGGAGGHQGIAEDGVDHGAQREVLGMRTHGPAGQEDDDTRNQVAFRSSAPRPAQPDAHQAGAPPNDAHAGVLDVVPAPRLAPSVLRKRIDHPPRRDQERIVELLTPAGPPQPDLAHQQDHRHHNPISDKRRAHDKVRQTLAQVIRAAVAHGRDATKEHLHPRHHRHHLAHRAVHSHHVFSNPEIPAPAQMQFEIDADDDLDDQHQHERRRERGVDVRRELPAPVPVAEEPGHDGDDGP